MDDKPKHKPQQMLMHNLNFTEDELALNRNGRLSQVQVGYLQVLCQQEYNRLSGPLVFCLLISLFGCILFILFVTSVYSTTFAAIIASAVMLVAREVVHRARVIRAFRQDMAQWCITCSSGIVRLSLRRDQFIVSLDDYSWPVRKHVFLAFKNGDPYILYFTPRTRTLLAAEWLGDR